MIETKIKIADWAKVTTKAAEETLREVLAMESVKVIDGEVDFSENYSGAYIPLTSQDYKLQIGLASNSQGCNLLTKQLLGTEPESKEDLADSIGEIVNMIVGAVKNEVNEKIKDLKIGLPIYVIGTIHPTENMERTRINIKLDDVTVQIIILQSRSVSESGA